MARAGEFARRAARDRKNINARTAGLRPIADHELSAIRGNAVVVVGPRERAEVDEFSRRGTRERKAGDPAAAVEIEMLAVLGPVGRFDALGGGEDARRSPEEITTVSRELRTATTAGEVGPNATCENFTSTKPSALWAQAARPT